MSQKSKARNQQLLAELALIKKNFATLESNNKAVLAAAAEAEIDAALDRELAEFQWEGADSRDLARTFYRQHLKRDDDGELMIGDRKFAEHLKSEIPLKYSMLLAKNKEGVRVKGGPSPADFIASVTPYSSPDDKAKAAKLVADALIM